MTTTHFRWSRNGKLRATEAELRELGFPEAKILGFGLPALRSADGFNTCPFAGACAGGCYAREGRYGFGAVQRALEHNLALVRHPDWDVTMYDELERVRPTHVRLHHSGDFFDEWYLSRWQTIARAIPWIHFYGYTKRPDAHLDFSTDHDGPWDFANWHVVQSEGGKLDGHLRDGRPHSRVFSSEEALAAAGYENCAHTDTALILGATKVGLVLHGRVARSREAKLASAGWVHAG